MLRPLQFISLFIIKKLTKNINFVQVFKSLFSMSNLLIKNFGIIPTIRILRNTHRLISIRDLNIRTFRGLIFDNNTVANNIVRDSIINILPHISDCLKYPVVDRYIFLDRF